MKPVIDEALIREQVRLALAEDVGTGDVSAALIPQERRARAALWCRESAVICGISWVGETFHQCAGEVVLDWRVADGDRVGPDTLLCTLHGPARALLTAERTALNFLQTLSATATVTRRYVEAVAGTGCRILDTRKTLPGLRRAQKYAVTCGGGYNHRFGLFDMVLIKENHIAAAGSIGKAVDAARRQDPDIPVEVEVEDMNQLREAIDAGVDRILLDNMDCARLREAVALTAGRVPLEASGGITLDNVRAVAETGVDFISIGSLTKDVKAVDLSLRFEDDG